MRSFILYNILDPNAASDHAIADHALDDFNTLAAGIQQNDRHGCKTGQAVSDRGNNHAGKEAVKQKCNICFPARA